LVGKIFFVKTTFRGRPAFTKGMVYKSPLLQKEANKAGLYAKK